MIFKPTPRFFWETDGIISLSIVSIAHFIPRSFHFLPLLGNTIGSDVHIATLRTPTIQPEASTEYLSAAWDLC
jgi:hypothetical protein